MSSPPKIVKIDLLGQFKKQQSSTSNNYRHQSPKFNKQFSFSNDLDDNRYRKQSPKLLKALPLARKLFNKSQSKQKNIQIVKTKGSPSKQNIDKNRQKQRNYNFNYEQVDEQNRFFKKSIDKLKRSFFSNTTMSQLTTKKILKEIGKYAENRKSKSKHTTFENKPKGEKYSSNIPIEFYGFKNTQVPSTENSMKFERAYNLTISSSHPKFSSLPYHQTIKDLKQQNQISEDQDEKNQTDQFYLQNVQINQHQINIICQIFEFCGMLDEHDVLTYQNLDQIAQQLQIRYSISHSRLSKKQQKYTLARIRFNNMISDLQENLKVIFSRRQKNNVFDTLYYLKQTNRLHLVCQHYMKIKRALQLQ